MIIRLSTLLTHGSSISTISTISTIIIIRGGWRVLQVIVVKVIWLRYLLELILTPRLCHRQVDQGPLFSMVSSKFWILRCALMCHHNIRDMSLYLLYIYLAIFALPPMSAVLACIPFICWLLCDVYFSRSIVRSSTGQQFWKSSKWGYADTIFSM